MTIYSYFRLGWCGDSTGKTRYGVSNSMQVPRIVPVVHKMENLVCSIQNGTCILCKLLRLPAV